MEAPAAGRLGIKLCRSVRTADDSAIQSAGTRELEDVEDISGTSQTEGWTEPGRFAGWVSLRSVSPESRKVALEGSGARLNRDVCREALCRPGGGGRHVGLCRQLRAAEGAAKAVRSNACEDQDARGMPHPVRTVPSQAHVVLGSGRYGRDQESDRSREPLMVRDADIQAGRASDHAGRCEG